MVIRKKYSKEFKLDAVSLVIEQDYNRAEAARSLGINASMLGRWVREHQAGLALLYRWLVGRGIRGELLYRR
jgi:transposase